MPTQDKKHNAESIKHWKDEAERTVAVTITMKFGLLRYIEKERGYESRSKFLCRIISEGLGLGEMVQ